MRRDVRRLTSMSYEPVSKESARERKREKEQGYRLTSIGKSGVIFVRSCRKTRVTSTRDLPEYVKSSSKQAQGILLQIEKNFSSNLTAADTCFKSSSYSIEMKFSEKQQHQETQLKQKTKKNGTSSGNNCLALAFSITAIFSCFLLVTFWCTNAFQDIIVSDLAIRNGTMSFAFWQKSPVKLLHKIYIFNYTNVEDFEKGRASKLKLQEVGPYVYRETLKRVNIRMHENSTVTYQEERSFTRDGGSSEDETVIVPNIPLLSAIAYSRDHLNFVAQVLFTGVLTTLQPKTFVQLKAGDFLWGYDDGIFKLAKNLITSKNHPSYEKFGILAMKNGLSADRITIHTGYDDIENLGMMQLLNGEQKRDVWKDEECDRIYGTDGSMFPPSWIRDRNSSIQIYVADLCRTMPLEYHGKSFAQGMPSLRYKFPKDLFDWSHKKDSCFCHKIAQDSTSDERACPPIGTFNSSACSFGSPIVMSFPHFYSGESWLLQQFDGLKPQQTLHETFLDLHPRLGTPINGASRLQINVEVRKATGVPFTGKLKDGSILPVAWVDASINDIPESVLDILQKAVYLAAIAEKVVKWGSLVLFLICISALYIFVICSFTRGHIWAR